MNANLNRILPWFLISQLFFTISCQEKSETTEKNQEPYLAQKFNSLSDKKLNVGFVMLNGVYNSELMAPYDIFHHTVFHHDKGMKVFTIAPDLGPIVTFEGIKILPDYGFNSSDLPEIDILVVPSAEHNMDSDLENETLINFVRQKGESAAFSISLCDGAFILAQAGLVEGHVSTTFPSDIAYYREKFPTLDVRESVSFVHDNNLITSAGGAKSYDAALYLCELLYGEKIAQGIAGGLVIDWDLSKISHLTINDN